MAQVDPSQYKSSEIRDRLANERTLLAWVRTSVTLMAFGVALTKFSLYLHLAAAEHQAAATALQLPDPRISQLVGAVLVAAGGAISLVGAWRSRAYSQIIDPDGKPPSNLPLATTAGLSATLACALLIYVLAT